MRLQGRTAMITGTASGIGREIVLSFAREGATVVLTDIDVDGLCGIRAEIGVNVADFNRVAEFCAAATIPTVFVSPGAINPGQSMESSLTESARQLHAMMTIADRHGVVLSVEPHVGSNLESPEAATELLSLVDGLRLTLDYSHFVFLGYAQSEIDPLIPHAAHIHLRQARPGCLQERLELGTINFPAMIAALRSTGYTGWLTIEYCHQPFMGMLNVDVLSETLKMRDLVVSCCKDAELPFRDELRE